MLHTLFVLWCFVMALFCSVCPLGLLKSGPHSLHSGKWEMQTIVPPEKRGHSMISHLLLSQQHIGSFSVHLLYLSQNPHRTSLLHIYHTQGDWFLFFLNFMLLSVFEFGILFIKVRVEQIFTEIFFFISGSHSRIWRITQQMSGQRDGALELCESMSGTCRLELVIFHGDSKCALELMWFCCRVRQSKKDRGATL